jgi:hypothetical protein
MGRRYRDEPDPRALRPDVLVPDIGVARDEALQEVDAGLRVEVDDGHAALPQPVDAALERARLAHHHGPDAELADQPAAVPARGERGDHRRVAVRAPAAGVPECLGLPMGRRVAALHALVVTAAEQLAGGVEQRAADRDSALRQPGAGFLERHGKHRLVVGHARQLDTRAQASVASTAASMRSSPGRAALSRFFA